MKRNRIYRIIAALLLTLLVMGNTSYAQQKAVERIYISTDRDTYLAGESIWISLYCLDLASPGTSYSNLSSVAYAEIQNAESTTVTAKLHLNNGRGSGKIDLPVNLPTGNYKIVVYTKQILNEAKPQPALKNIAIFNTLTTDRVKSGVDIVAGGSEDNSVITSPVQEPELSIYNINSQTISLSKEDSKVIVNRSYPFEIKNLGSDLVSLNISLSRAENLPRYSEANISRFLNELPKDVATIKVGDKYTPEYEGEVIEGKILGADFLSGIEYLSFISAVGNKADVYSTFANVSGDLKFFTNSIFGKREIALEVMSVDTNMNIHIELKDPFVKRGVGEFSKLLLSPVYANALNERSIEMQLGRRFGIDTLYDKIKISKDPLLNIKPIIYNLDDYTRFPVMQEITVEYIPELRFRKVDKMIDLQVRWETAFNMVNFSKASTLVLLDGIPVFNHKKIYDYDPLKVKSIEIYPGEFLIGAVRYDGIVMFHTYKGDYPNMKFGKNTKISDYDGVQYPCMFSANKVVTSTNFPDLRTLLYWNPQIDLTSGESKKFVVHTSGLPGEYIVKIEGLTSKGEAVIYYDKITVLPK